jgi:beta-mannosidase
MRQSFDRDGWRVRPFLGDEWQHHRAHQPGPIDHARWWAARVPGSVIADAARAGAVPDPYTGLNSRAAEWLADRTVVYRTEFGTPDLGVGDRATLVLEGIDYSGRVFCDGIDLGAHEGEFTPFTADVTDLVTGGEEHLLAVVVDPAPVSEPQVGRTSRVRVAKTRMNYGWDFCPRSVHQGIWQPAYLDISGPVRIHRVLVDTDLDAPVGAALDTGRAADMDTAPGPDGQHADGCTVTVSVALDAGRGAGPTGDIGGTVTILDPDGTQIATRHWVVDGAAPRASEHPQVRVPVAVPAPQLWWPNGFGGQPLYRAVVEVSVGGRSSHRCEVRFGIRHLAFRQVAGANPESLPYLPVVNGTPVPVRGWNWVPADLAYGATDPATVRHLVELAARAGVTMLRVWGGGLIETEAFYDACDDFGILVWQEFIQSSSGVESTPAADSDFVTRLATEAEAAVLARRHHPCLAIWCGGNELADARGNPLDAPHPAIAALARVAGRIDPGRLFLPTSPSGPAFTNEPGGTGEQHDVHGPWEHQGLAGQYARYDAASCQLLSEFGVEGMAHRRVLDHVVGAAGLVMPTRGTELWDHLGRWWNNEALVQAAFGGGITDFDQLSRCSQFLQADGLRYAVQAQRRRWPACAGTIAWQLNEPFPNAWCTSAVDYTGEPKPAYYAVAAAHAQLHVCAKVQRQTFAGEPDFAAELVVLLDDRPPGTWDGPAPALRPPGTPLADPATGVSPDAGSVPVTVRASVTDLLGTVLAEYRTAVAVTPGSPCPAGDIRAEFAGAATAVVLLTVDARTAAGARSRSRYLVSAADDLADLLTLPDAELSVTAVPGNDRPDPAAGSAWTVTVRNDGPVTAVFCRLTDGRPYGSPGWMVAEDSGFHLLPGESVTLAVRWTGVPPQDRTLLVDAFNRPPMRVTAQAVPAAEVG